MPRESEELSEARRHLSEVEADFPGPDSEFHLIEGLDLLEGIVAGRTPEAKIATNLGNTYFRELTQRIESALVPGNITEPTLKRLMKLSQALDQSMFAQGSQVGTLTTLIACRYMDAILEGYSPEEKDREIQKALARLHKHAP